PDPPARERLRALGGTVLDRAEDVAPRCGTMIWSLPGPSQVEDTFAALEPLLEPGKIILDTTTGNPDDVARHARLFAVRGVSYLDCEIGGSSRQAASGDAIVICGGEPAAVESARGLLDAISPRVFHTGPAGTATRMKLALNIAIGLHRAVLAESLTFAERNGIDPALALEILKASPAYSRAMDVKGTKMLMRDYTPDARLAQHLKDVRIILSTGSDLGAYLPLSEVHERLLSKAVELGLGGMDNSAVKELFGKASA
ncbi:MAG: NAD(P)-dependent oxidoreductase, partial [Bryobacterales bacterium]|nr:NAD(P)-dependent oxidoreductase [Bryobacterales bacterium]